jgi:hypothetical protein
MGRIFDVIVHSVFNWANTVAIATPILPNFIKVGMPGKEYG